LDLSKLLLVILNQKSSLIFAVKEELQKCKTAKKLTNDLLKSLSNNAIFINKSK